MYIYIYIFFGGCCCWKIGKQGINERGVGRREGGWEAREGGGERSVITYYKDVGPPTTDRGEGGGGNSFCDVQCTCTIHTYNMYAFVLVEYSTYIQWIHKPPLPCLGAQLIADLQPSCT